MDRPIARYVRQVVRAEAPDVAAATLAEVRQLEDRFGLTHMSMLRLRWEITPAEPVERPSESAQKPKRHLIVIDDPSNA